MSGTLRRERVHEQGRAPTDLHVALPECGAAASRHIRGVAPAAIARARWCNGGGDRAGALVSVFRPALGRVRTHGRDADEGDPQRNRGPAPALPDDSEGGHVAAAGFDGARRVCGGRRPAAAGRAVRSGRCALPLSRWRGRRDGGALLAPAVRADGTRDRRQRHRPVAGSAGPHPERDRGLGSRDCRLLRTQGGAGRPRRVGRSHHGAAQRRRR